MSGTIHLSVDAIQAYFSDLPHDQQYAWMAIVVGILLVIIGAILW